ncbi:SGM_5486 family transporter-associated protein [Streptacidiphilus sp. PAMC 29251]
MPVLEPNPTGGHKKLLQFFGLILAILVVIGILASFATKMG